MSDYLEEALMKAVFRNTAYSPPANIYVALFTATPSDAGGGTEVSGTNYARQAVDTTSGWAAPSAVSGGFKTSNVAAIEFPVAGDDGGTIEAVGLFDDDGTPSGNLLWWWTVVTPQACGTGSQVKFAIGALTITLGS
jgi:hypothetical protein